MTAVIKNHNGTPTVFINDEPHFYSLMWGSAPTPDGYALHDCAKRYADAGVHFFTFDIGTVGTPPEWCGPKPGLKGHLDFSSLEERFLFFLKADSKACFHLRVHLEMPEWWQKLYPQECELVSDGRRLCQSYASKIWRDQAKDFLRELITHIKSIGLGERIIAYQCGTGSTGEWVKGPSAMGLVCGDYSQSMRQHFQTWLRKQYHDDEIFLRAAWGNSTVTFVNATIPSADAQFNTTQYTFRNPRKEQQVIDYYRCLSDLCADLLIDFCTTVKKYTDGKALAGAFYGYLMELAWNAGFFGEGVDSEYSTYQRSGHLGLSKVLTSSSVDFLVSPYSYGFRGIGGDGSAMPPSESLRIHNKLYIFEDDTRTHLTLHDRPNYGKADTLEDSIAILKRNFSYVITHGHGMWWLCGGGPQTPHIDLSQQPDFFSLIEQFQDIGEFALNLNRTPSSEIAVLVDDESFYYEWLKNSLDVPLIFQQRLWGLAHLGAPYDVYLLDDFITRKIKPYKLYVFLNAFHIGKDRREALKTEIRKEERVALWIYAPGYIADECNVDNMLDLTGISFGFGEHPWGPVISLTDLNHPISRGLSQDLTWGTNSLLGPIFHVADPEVKVLGNVIYSQGRCQPGFVVKEFPEWTSIYCATPNIPASILRGIAAYAGVHIYSSEGDILYVTHELLALHTASGGNRNLKLARRVEIVYDLFSKSTIATGTDNFNVELPPASTALYFLGEPNSLDRLH